jgi:hypothetical protein
VSVERCLWQVDTLKPAVWSVFFVCSISKPGLTRFGALWGPLLSAILHNSYYVQHRGGSARAAEYLHCAYVGVAAGADDEDSVEAELFENA